MEIDFSLLNNLKNDALKCPTSEVKGNTRISTPKTKESQPQGKYEGESGNCLVRKKQTITNNNSRRGSS